MNNRGELTLEEIVTIILSVLGIGALLYLVSGMLGIFGSKSSLDQAQANLNQIIFTIADLKETKTDSFLLESPKDWYLTFYSTGSDLPISCQGGACLCLCEGDSYDDCDSEGVCENVAQDIIIRTDEGDSFNLETVPVEVFFSFEKNSVLLSDKEVAVP